MYDNDGYPTEEALQQIDTWSGNARELIDFINEIWWPQDTKKDGYKWDVVEGKDRIGDDGYNVSCSTWGWSGNEEIIDRLHGTWLWMRCWESSVRGGHYTFHLSKKEMDEPSPVGWGKIISSTEGKNDSDQS